MFLAGCETTEVRPSRETIYAIPVARPIVATAYAPVPPLEYPPAETPGVAGSPLGNPILWPSAAPPIYAKSAILIDANSGRVLYQKNADHRRPVASTQKLLTGLIIAEEGALSRPVRIAPVDCYVEPTKLNVRPGDVYTRRQLLNAMMVKSCNDAAAALGRDYAGSTPAFASVMNHRARQMGANSSYFMNANGLPAPQYSTARDMARIAFRAYRNSDLRAAMRLPGYTFVMATGRRKYLEATNKLLLRSSMYNGMKTGYTNSAGRCLITSATSRGRSLILVQLGSTTRYVFNDAERMIAWGFNRSSGGALAFY